MRDMADTANERIIAVMGATGSGKSALIRLVTGNEKIQVGSGLISGTYKPSLLIVIQAGKLSIESQLTLLCEFQIPPMSPHTASSTAASTSCSWIRPDLTTRIYPIEMFSRRYPSGSPHHIELVRNCLLLFTYTGSQTQECKAVRSATSQCSRSSAVKTAFGVSSFARHSGICSSAIPT
jgi:energy-coupling factor transporter ATP-binding protein EcfA2